MIRLLLGAALAAALAGCAPLTSRACDHVDALCHGEVDVGACDSIVSLAPPYVRRELLDCTAAATSCDAAVACFAQRGYTLPRAP